MTIDHIAIFTNQLELLRNYYEKYFGASTNNLYFNEKKQFRSYFLSFDSGARIEIMSMPGIPANLNDTVKARHLGLIHLAFHIETIGEVDAKARQLESNGYKIIDGPRKTGDGYYEFVTLDPDGNRIEVTTDYAALIP